ncbi:MAG: hypothetical protein JXQ87_15200 [Bacteroidia bacterium]
MRRIFTTIILVLPALVSAQTNEFGASIGLSNYLGDLAPSVSIKEFHPQFGAFAKRNRANGFVSWKYAINYATISGSDANFERNTTRNLDFKTNLLEASVQFEFNFQKFFIGLRAEKFSPYAFIGLGGVYFNPQGTYNGEWIDLRPLSTEGQGLNGGPNTYSNFALIAPMGGGFKWELGRRWNIYAYSGFRYSFSDYLDDVSSNYFDLAEINEQKGEIAANMADKSDGQIFNHGKQRGNSQRSDWYFFTGFSISYWLLDKNCFNFK